MSALTKAIFALLLLGCSTAPSHSPDTSRNPNSKSIDCQPTDEEAQFLAAITTLRKKSLWKTYPRNYNFIILDKDNASTGFIEARDAAQAEAFSTGALKNIISLCKNNLFKSIVGQENFLKDPDFYPQCTQNVRDTCSSYPELNTFFQATQEPIGAEIIDRKRLVDLAQNIFRANQIYSPLQGAVYNSYHEMFHDYQDSFFGDYLKYDLDCKADGWVQSQANERKWFISHAHAIYSNRDRAKLIKMAKELLQLRDNPLHTYCVKNYALQERHEGMAHYIGNRALVESKTITLQRLGEVDIKYLEADANSFGTINVYATGGLIAQLVSKIAPANYDWKSQIEAGATQYDILKKLASQK